MSKAKTNVPPRFRACAHAPATQMIVAAGRKSRRVDARISRTIDPAFNGASAAIAAGLAKGQSIRDAVVAARAFVRDAISDAQTLHNGARILSLS